MQVFCPKSTCSKEIVLFWDYGEHEFVKKCRNRTFKVNFLCQKSTEFFQKKIILGQKTCILGPTIFKIPQPNWYYYLLWLGRVLWKKFSRIFSDFPAQETYKKSWANLQIVNSWTIKFTKTQILPNSKWFLNFIIQELKFFKIASIHSVEKIWEKLIFHKKPSLRHFCHET